MPAGNLLEIGVGNGSHLTGYQKHRVTGIDTSEAMLTVARKNSHERITLLNMNGESLQFEDQKFDYVVLSHVIAVVDNPEQLMKEALRVLKPHGQIFILNHFTPDNWLKYIDRAGAAVARTLHFKSLFHIEEIAAVKQVTLVKEIKLGPASYFKILTYQKN